jgi:hypothetical protein
LGEVVLVLVVSSLVIATLLSGLVALMRGMQPRSVVVAGECLPIAPTFGSFPSAVRLHQALTDRVTTARAVYVFGGRHLSIPEESADARLQPLRRQALPVLENPAAGLATDAASFLQTHADELGEQESASSPDDYSLLVIGPAAGGLAATCFVQVRRKDVTTDDGGGPSHYVVREVKLWDIDSGAQRYAFAEPAAVSARLFVGAVHTWLRYQTNGAKEEGPACVVFPDPWLYSGAMGRPDDIPPFSRFSYFLPVSP